MATVLGLIGFVFYILCVISTAAAVTWLVVKFSPSRKPVDEQPSSTA
jgi:hypothetical protein